MKKTLIALAVVGAVGAAHAQSSVTVYGQLNPSYDYVVADPSNGVDGKIKTLNMNDNSSRIGVKGSEDLGGGLKAVFQLEAYYNMVDKTGFDGSRDSWVGLSGKMGTLTFGAHDNAVKKVFAAYDPFGDTIADYNNIFSNSIKSRNAKSAFYTSPTVGGFTGYVSFALENAREKDNDSTHDARMAIAGEYKNGPLKVTAGYAKYESDAADAKNLRIGAEYTLPSKTVLSAVFDKESGDDSAQRKAYMVGVKHPIGNVDLIGNFIYAGDSSGNDDGAKNLNLGVKYNFSKRTNVMAMYSYLKNDDAGSYELDSGYAVSTGAGAKYTAFSVRLQHNF